MKLLKFFAAVIAVLFLLNGYIKAEAKTQTHCPVMNVEINKSLYVDKDGKRIYVCCGSCVSEVTQNFDKYAKQLTDNGIELEKVSQ